MKKLLLQLIALLVIHASISGCSDLDFDFEVPPSGGSGNWGYDSIPYYVPITDTSYHAAFSIDSLIQTSKSEVTIWAQIRFDSILIINRITTYAGYLDQEVGKGYNEVQTEPDTIDFTQLPRSTSLRNGRSEGIYKYNVKVKDLNSDHEYWACVIYDYTEYTPVLQLVRADYNCSDFFSMK